jgi:glycosyltransferase involved in cell wall biosynthesis
MDQVLVSVVIPCYNHGKYIGEAINSIFNGEYSHWEIIIVDDGSSDAHTREVLSILGQQSNVKIVSQPNGGPAQARNTGIAQANGEYLFFLDADNLVMPTYITEAAEVLATQPAVGVVYADALLIGEKNERWASATDGNIWKSLAFDHERLMGWNFIDNCTLVRKCTIDQVGGYEPDRTIQGWEDWELWLKIAKTDWRFHYLEKPMFYYRTLPDSMSSKTVECNKRITMLNFMMDRHPDLLKIQYRNLAKKYCQLEKTANDYEKLVASREYKLGKAIIAPLAKTRRLLTGRFRD